MDDYEHERKSYLQLVLMAYRFSALTVTKFSPSNVVLRTNLGLAIESMYKTRHAELFPTPGVFIFNTKTGILRENHLVRAEMEVEHSRQKTYYEYCAYGPTYNEGEEVRVLFPTVKKGETKKFACFHKDSYIFLEIINALSFRVCNDGRKKFKKNTYND